MRLGLAARLAEGTAADAKGDERLCGGEANVERGRGLTRERPFEDERVHRVRRRREDAREQAELQSEAVDDVQLLLQLHLWRAPLDVGGGEQHLDRAHLQVVPVVQRRPLPLRRAVLVGHQDGRGRRGRRRRVAVGGRRGEQYVAHVQHEERGCGVGHVVGEHDPRRRELEPERRRGPPRLDGGECVLGEVLPRLLRRVGHEPRQLGAFGLARHGEEGGDALHERRVVHHLERRGHAQLDLKVFLAARRALHDLEHPLRAARSARAERSWTDEGVAQRAGRCRAVGELDGAQRAVGAHAHHAIRQPQLEARERELRNLAAPPVVTQERGSAGRRRVAARGGRSARRVDRVVVHDGEREHVQAERKRELRRARALPSAPRVGTVARVAG